MSAMSVRTGAAIVAAAALLGLVARPAAQDPKRTFTETPEFMPTAVTVTGRVSVDNSPIVQAQQARMACEPGQGSDRLLAAAAVSRGRADLSLWVVIDRHGRVSHRGAGLQRLDPRRAAG